MANTESVIRYVPLGWSTWLYGPIFAIAGAFGLWTWWNEISHRVANSSVDVQSMAEWFQAATCFSSRCDSFEHVFGAAAWGAFFFFVFGVFLVGILMMNMDRSTIVQNGKLTTRRGNFFHWQKESLSRGDIASIDIQKVPVFGIIWIRVYHIGDKWRVTATLKRKGITGSPKKRVLALTKTEAEARAIASRCSL